MCNTREPRHYLWIHVEGTEINRVNLKIGGEVDTNAGGIWVRRRVRLLEPPLVSNPNKMIWIDGLDISASCRGPCFDS